jgi:hypothetical protein
MRLAEAAWSNVDTTTIRNCWEKAGILPPIDMPPGPATPSVPISFLIHDTSHLEDPVLNAEKEVEAALSDLMSTGVLQKSNQMSVEALLNSVEESQVMDETTDEEICHAVQNSRKVQEISCSGGSGDDDADDDAQPEEFPSHQEVLRATSIIEEFVARMDDQLARKMESLLHSFRQQLHLEAARNMVAMSITDYFKPV